MSTRKIVVQSTDEKFIGKEITVAEGEATVDGFSFEVIRQVGDRIVGANYSVTFETVEV
jgi:hypothetical protein